MTSTLLGQNRPLPAPPPPPPPPPPPRRVECTRGREDLRAPVGQDPEKPGDDLPMRGEVPRNEIGKPRKVGTLGRHGVEKPREARGERGSLPRRYRGLPTHLAPSHHQLRQQQTPAQLRDGRRHRQCLAVRLAFGEAQLVRIEIADRPHPRPQPPPPRP